MMQQPMIQMQQPMMQSVMMGQQPMVMMPQQQPMVMMPQQQPMFMVPQPQSMMMSPTSATGANAAQLIEEQLHPATESAASSMLDVAPEVKSDQSSSSSSSSSSSEQKEGTRVIKLS
jgi:hypothetical protein